ncbi:MAG: hypothetical protein PHX51_07715 [Clostridia bacterium]|nr:hypothetical protein [Clostridia bacterium]
MNIDLENKYYGEVSKITKVTAFELAKTHIIGYNIGTIDTFINAGNADIDGSGIIKEYADYGTKTGSTKVMGVGGIYSLRIKNDAFSNFTYNASEGASLASKPLAKSAGQYFTLDSYRARGTVSGGYWYSNDLVVESGRPETPDVTITVKDYNNNVYDPNYIEGDDVLIHLSTAYADEDKLDSFGNKLDVKWYMGYSDGGWKLLTNAASDYHDYTTTVTFGSDHLTFWAVFTSRTSSMSLRVSSEKVTVYISPKGPYNIKANAIGYPDLDEIEVYKGDMVRLNCTYGGGLDCFITKAKYQWTQYVDGS